MIHSSSPRLLALLALLPLTSHVALADGIRCPSDAPDQVRLAAKELRRYVYVRTGELLPIGAEATGRTISLRIDPALGAETYRLKSDGDALAITGGSPVAVLYGAYDLAGKFGMRFYLHGDAAPDGKIPFALPTLDETHAPLFVTRGIQPFHDFAEGPDW